jgi:hypothetical protein
MLQHLKAQEAETFIGVRGIVVQHWNAFRQKS